MSSSRSKGLIGKQVGRKWWTLVKCVAFIINVTVLKATIDQRMLACITNKPLITFYKQADGKTHKIKKNSFVTGVDYSVHTCPWLGSHRIGFWNEAAVSYHCGFLEWSGRVLPLDFRMKRPCLTTVDFGMKRPCLTTVYSRTLWLFHRGNKKECVILHTRVRASWMEFNNRPTRCDLFSLLHFRRQPIILRIIFVNASNIQYNQSRILNYILVLIAAYFTHCS